MQILSQTMCDFWELAKAKIPNRKIFKDQKSESIFKNSNIQINLEIITQI